MELTQVVNRLHHQGAAILSICTPVSETQAYWKPDPENWSVWEVLNHLLLEERQDFRRHLGEIFQNSKGISSEAGAKNRGKEPISDPGPLSQLLLQFKAERETSIAWLKALHQPDWEAAISFEWGSLSAADLLASWLAHDLLHLRQLVALQYQLTVLESQPFSVKYAGEW